MESSSALTEKQLSMVQKPDIHSTLVWVMDGEGVAHLVEGRLVIERFPLNLTYRRGTNSLPVVVAQTG